MKKSEYRQLVKKIRGKEKPADQKRSAIGPVASDSLSNSHGVDGFRRPPSFHHQALFLPLFSGEARLRRAFMCE